jgi:hypothetical protein
LPKLTTAHESDLPILFLLAPVAMLELKIALITHVENFFSGATKVALHEG